MVDDTLEDAGSRPESGRPKRNPPTIDLKASEVSSETKPAPETRPPRPGPAAEAKSEPQLKSEPGSKPGNTDEQASKPDEKPASAQPENVMPPPAARPVSPWVIAPFSGAVAAALVIGIGWMLGWPPVPAPPAPSPSVAAIDDLSARVAGLETKSKQPALDPVLASRLGALEKAAAASQSDLASLHAQADRLASAASAAPATPGNAADVAALNERIDQLEHASRTQSADAAREAAKAADDVPLRRVVAAALLDVAVRHGDPYPAALAAAKSLSPNPDALKPLDEFAAGGVPNPPALSRELLTLVPKLSPPQDTTATTGTGLVDRLQAGAAKLVRIERTDSVGNDRGAIVSRVTAAALRNEFGEARRELLTLAPADRAAAQGWLDKVAAREAALAASRQFAEDSMSALAKPPQ
jgi:hypothetical protein